MANCGNRNLHSERGQATLVVILAVSIFLLGFVALAVDFSNLWFHRQSAQAAADAACQAGAMDLLFMAQGIGSTTAGFDPSKVAYPSNIMCSSGVQSGFTVKPVPCAYAAFNGYNAGGLANGEESNEVYLSFPANSDVSGLGIAGVPAKYATYPFLRVDITDRARVYFSALFTGNRTQDVKATAICGLQNALAPIPMIILNPNDPATLSSNGSPNEIKIVGGPKRSIQVNSSSPTAVQFSGTIDLSHGGPDFSGSAMGTYGGPATSSAGVGNFLAPPGAWIYKAPPISDPFASYVFPDKTAANFSTTFPSQSGPYAQADGGTNGCPENPGTKCDEYKGGYYPTGITIKNMTAIFEPGMYYVDKGFTLDSNSTVRPSTLAGDGSGGTVFFLDKSGTFSVNANAGRFPPPTDFLVSNLKCAAAASAPTLTDSTGATITSLSQSVLMGPCTGPYGDNTSTPPGQYHGMLLFQQRTAAVSPNWQGGGGIAFAGDIYFHQCVTSGADTSPTCDTKNAYKDVVSFGGNPSSETYVLGDIIVDALHMSGKPKINMQLNPNQTNSILKVQLLQ